MWISASGFVGSSHNYYHTVRSYTPNTGTWSHTLRDGNDSSGRTTTEITQAPGLGNLTAGSKTVKHHSTSSVRSWCPPVGMRVTHNHQSRYAMCHPTRQMQHRRRKRTRRTQRTRRRKRDRLRRGRRSTKMKGWWGTVEDR